MINTNNVFISAEEIPSTWIFQYYGKLSEKLTGQSVKIKSIVNAKDTNPSLVFYVKGNQYLFQDFSTGIGGDKVSFVKMILEHESKQELPYYHVHNVIISDYVNYLENNGHLEEQLKKEEKWKIVSYTTRGWYMYDAKFWSKFGISSDVLDHFNVKPLKSTVMNRGNEFMEISKNNSYAYTKKDGSIYKIYLPNEEKEKRFKNFNNKYYQGQDQLTYTRDSVVICSSLKDGMSLYGFNLDLDIVAPNSETTMLSDKFMSDLKAGYKNVYVLFDNDEVGIKATLKYEKKYETKSLYLKMAKDISDSVAEHGKDLVKQEFIKLIQ